MRLDHGRETTHIGFAGALLAAFMLAPVAVYAAPQQDASCANPELARLNDGLTDAEARPDRADADKLRGLIQAFIGSATVGATDDASRASALDGFWSVGKRLRDVGLKASAPRQRERLLMLAVTVYDSALGQWRREMPAVPEKSAAAMYLELARTYGDLGYRDDQAKCCREIVSGRFDGTRTKPDVQAARALLREAAPEDARREDRRHAAGLAAIALIALAAVGFMSHTLRQHHIRRYHRPPVTARRMEE